MAAAAPSSTRQSIVDGARFSLAASAAAAAAIRRRHRRIAIVTFRT